MTTSEHSQRAAGDGPARLREACLLISLVQARTGASLVSRLGETLLQEVLEMSAVDVAERARLSPKARAGFKQIQDSFDEREVPGLLEEAEAGSDAGELGEPLPEAEMRTLQGVGFKTLQMDEISRHSGVGIKELLPALSMLELKGYVMRDAVGAFLRRGR